MSPMRILAFLGFVALLGARDEPHTEGAFDRDGVRLHYHASGSGTPVVLLSGGPGLEVDYMKAVADFLPATHRRIFYEQRGTGRSRVELSTGSMTLAHVVADLDALRIHLEQERLFLVGHSWGGMLAMAYAAVHPEHVDRMILIGSGGPTLEFLDWFEDNIEARLRPEDVEARRHWSDSADRGADPDKVAVERLRAITPAYAFDRAKGLEFADAMKDGDYHEAVNSLLFEDLVKHYDARPGLTRLARPVLIVHGHQDPIGAKTAEEIHASIKGSELKYIKKCGHFPWLEQPDRFREVIAEFLE